MPRTRPPYPPEFRAEAIELVRSSGKSRRAIAQELGISTETLRQWVKQADIDAGLRHDGLSSAEAEEVRRLRREIKELREKQDCLKRFREHVTKRKWLKAADMDAIDKEVLQLIDDSVKDAIAAAPPLPEDLTTDVYVSY